MTQRLMAIHAVLDRPRLWRVTAVLALLLLCGIIVGAAQGSLQVLERRPAVSSSSWERWCTRGQVREDRRRLAFCARIDGLVLSSSRGPAVGEAHVAIVGDFHLTIVRLPDRAPIPSAGTRMVVVGPMVRARNGQREVQAFKVLDG